MRQMQLVSDKIQKKTSKYESKLIFTNFLPLYLLLTINLHTTNHVPRDCQLC